MKNQIIIVGAFHEIIELAEDNNLKIAGLIDNKKKDNYKGYKILCDDQGAKDLSKIYQDYFIIITPDSPRIRKHLQSYYSKLGFNFISLFSKDAKISKSSDISNGTIIQYGVNVSAECKIGKFVKLNTYCNIMHNSVIDNYTTVAPNAVVLGNIKVGKSCYIGANSTILPNLIIEDNVIIGASSIVTKNIRQGKTIYGIPAKEKM